MAYLLKDGTLVRLDPPSVERCDLRVEGSLVTLRADRIEVEAKDEVVDLKGKLVLPGQVCAHTHLYSALARGMPAPPRTPGNFNEILELIWWRLDRALDEESIYCSALAGAIDAARAGTTCLFDHHASPSAIGGALQIVREAVEQVGIRAVLCYEVTDRGGRGAADQGIAENRSFIEWCAKEATGTELAAGARFRALVGAHASFTLSDASLKACAELMREFNAGFHIHAAEDMCDVKDAHERYGMGVVERLAKASALNSKTILAHGVHLDEREIETANAANAWFVHNPRSNMNNQVGYAPVAKFGPRVLLGTDGIGADMFEEARFAFFNGRDARGGLAPDAWMRVLANNQRLASELFGSRLDVLESGSPADLIVVDYDSPTPVTSGNLAWHLMFGISSANVESTMVGGRFIIRERATQLDTDSLYRRIRAASDSGRVSMPEKSFDSSMQSKPGGNVAFPNDTGFVSMLAMPKSRSNRRQKVLILGPVFGVVAILLSGCRASERAPAAGSSSSPVSAPTSAPAPAVGGEPELTTMDVAQAVMVTVELDFGSRPPTVEAALLDIERRSQPDDGKDRTFAILDGDGWPTPEGKLHLQMHVSSEKPGLAWLIFKPTGEVLWRAKINPTTMPPRTKQLIILMDNGSGKTLLIDGSNNPSSILVANIKELGKPVQDNWADGTDREFTFTYSACGCPVKAMVRRMGDRTVRVQSKRLDGSTRDPNLPVLFPDDPAAVSVISRLMLW
jgi:putative selenium metabolism protein SsnA